MKNTIEKDGFINRHLNPLPLHKCRIIILTEDLSCEHQFLCSYTPLDKSKYNETNMPAQGYLGTAKVIAGKHIGIEFHVWENNNSEFVYYKHAASTLKTHKRK